MMIMMGIGQAQISAGLSKVPEHDLNFVQRSADTLINRLM
jgi:hypothetical protein